MKEQHKLRIQLHKVLTVSQNLGWDDTVTIGTLSIQKSTDTYQYGHHAVPIHLEVSFHTLLSNILSLFLLMFDLRTL